MVKLNRNDIAQTKNPRLEWALSNADFGSFKYYQKDNDGTAVESTQFVKGVLRAFRQNRGHYINSRSMNCQCYTYYKDKIEEGEKQFRDALIKHLYTLIGVEPNVAIGSDKVNYVISYC
jgi:hypothetical protein